MRRISLSLGRTRQVWYTDHMNAEESKTAIRPRHRWVIPLIVIPLVLQFVLPSRTWIVLFVTLGGAVGIAYFWARQLADKVTLTRQQHYGWIHVGDLLEERFMLHNRSFLPLMWLEIDDQSDLPGDGRYC